MSDSDVQCSRNPVTVRDIASIIVLVTLVSMFVAIVYFGIQAAKTQRAEDYAGMSAQDHDRVSATRRQIVAGVPNGSIVTMRSGGTYVTLPAERMFSLKLYRLHGFERGRCYVFGVEADELLLSEIANITPPPDPMYASELTRELVCVR